MQKTQKALKIASNRKLKYNGESNFDPLGSYTGRVIDEKFEKPVQDADDL